MDNLDEFIRLSHYLKNHQLYMSFLDMDDRNRRTLSKLEANLEDKSHLTLEEQEELERYHKVLGQIECNNKLLESSFNNYDFSEYAAQEAETDYKLYAFEFIIDTIHQAMKGKMFRKKKEVINFIRAAERVIKKHFIQKFYIVEDLESLFEKATERCLEEALKWNLTSSRNFIESSQ
ncbi:MAG TPA: hypothetical protein ENI73_05010 [Spirochaetes bacterium]|nr:hypothetical protein [Spirochaetota bacterium]